MRYRILGPLEIDRDGVPVGVPAAKQRTLLGALLLHSGEVLSTERLVDELWGENPPATATKTIQVYVSQLRKLLGEDAIATRPPGYALRLDGAELDAGLFEQLIREARQADGPAAAATLYREALSLWRGPALDDVAFLSVTRHEVERLEDLRLAALTERIDCDLALGRHARLVGELQALAAENLVHERFVAQLMLALYGSGRQAEALEAYRAHRRRLQDELGIEPDEDIRRLETQILRHDPAVAPPAGAPDRGFPAERGASRRRGRILLLAAVAAAALAAVAALIVAAVEGGDDAAPLELVPGSVGLVDPEANELVRVVPVGKEPRAMVAGVGSRGVANYGDRTVTRVPLRGGDTSTIAMPGRPVGIAAAADSLWVATLEGTVVRLDPEFESVGEPIALAPETPGGVPLGAIVAAAGSLWVSSPVTTIFRLPLATPSQTQRLVPPIGTRGALTIAPGTVWAAGRDPGLVRIASTTGDFGFPVTLAAPAAALAFGFESVWVETESLDTRNPPALLRVEPQSGEVERISRIGEPGGVAVGAGSAWAGDHNAATLLRIDPRRNEVVARLHVGGRPLALASSSVGVWVTA